MTRTTRNTVQSAIGLRTLYVATGVFCALLAAQSASAATFIVTSTADTNTPGTLRFSINQANALGGSNIIDFAVAGSITLTTDLPNITSSIEFDGPGTSSLTIDGASTFRILFIESGTVNIHDLTLANGKASGGRGGHTRYSGGGGGAAGMGAAVFVNAGTVQIKNVAFTANTVTGGAGGNAFTSNNATSGGGGGGMGGIGGDPSGFDPTGGNGANGGALGGTGGAGGTSANGQAGGAGAGGGGGGDNSDGGAGGFGGGAGGSSESGILGGGVGGYGGGGGGGGESSGAGGAGGTLAGSGGTSSGLSWGGGGGGGAGLGGAIFARAGTTTILSCTLSSNSATRGLGGTAASVSYFGQDGQGKGGAIFVHSGATVYASGLSFSSNAASDDTATAGDDNDVYGTILPAFPSVVSINRVTATPTNSTTVQFAVTFDSAVTGVDISDFTLTTAMSGVSVTGVTGSGATYTATVNTGTGDGTIRLDVTDDDSIANATDSLGGTGTGNGDFNSGQVYTIDKTAPTATLSSVTANPTNGAVAVTVVLSESSVDFDNDSLTNVNAFSNAFTGSGINYSYNLIALTDGTITTTVPAGAFTDAAGNQNTVSNTITRIVDTVGPTISLTSSSGSTVNGAISVTAELSESSTNFISGDVTPTNATVSNFAGSATTYTFTLTPTTAGSFSASVAASAFTDAAGNNSAVSNTLTRTYDITVPSVSLTSAAAATVNAAITVTAELSETSINFASGDITPTNATVSNFAGSATTYTFTLTPTTAGSFSASVAAATFTDAAGNDNTVSNTLTRTYDITVPTVSLTSAAAATVNAAITVTAELSEDSTDFASGDITPTNATVSNFAGSATTYTFTLTPTTAGSFSASVAAATFTDAAGNDNTVSNTLTRTYDITVPTVSLTSTAAATVNAAITVTAELSEDSTDFASGDITPTNATVSNFAGSATTYTFTLTPTTAGSFSASVAAATFTDAAGNDNTVSNTLTRTYDITVPSVSLTSAAAATVNAAITVTAELSEDSTDFASGDITPTNATVSNFAGSATTYTFTLTPTTAGSFSASVAAATFTDSAGNDNTVSNTLTRTYDSAVPTISLTSASTTNVNAAITVTAELSEVSVNFASGDITPTNASVSNFAGSATTYTFTLTPTTAGSFSAAVAAATFSDSAGNDNAVSNTLTRFFDVTGPNVVLASAAAATVNAAITVTAELTEDSTSFASDDITPTNATVSNFAGSATSYTFTLTPTTSGSFSAAVGAATFTDSAGNDNTASNTLTRNYDVTVPTVSLASDAPATVNAAITVTAELSEDSINFASGDITPTNATVSNFAGSATTYTFTLTPTTAGSFSAAVAAATFTDSAGSDNTVSNTLTRTYDIAMPTVALTSASAPRVHAAITVTAELSEDSVDFASGDITPTNATVSNFAGSATTYTFTLTPTTAGSFSASVAAAAFTDFAGNASLASNTLERTLDTSAPGVLSIVPSTTGPTNALFVQFTVTFDGAVSDFDDETDVTVTHSGTASTGVNFTAVSDSVYTVEVTEISGAGSFTLSVNAGAAVDAAGNANPAFGPSPAVTMAQQTDLAIAAQASSASIVAGDPVTYTITITNNGPLVATNTVFSGSLPAGLTFVSATSTLGTVTHDGGTLTGGLGTMAVNDSVVITVVTVSSAGAIGELFVGTSVTTDEADSNTANNSAVAAVTVTAVQPNDNGNTNTNEDPDPIEPADIRVTIDFEQGDVKVGDAIPFHVTVLNAGGAAAEDVVLTFPIPEGTEFVSARLLGQDERFYKAPQAGSDLELLVTDETVTIQLPSVDAGESAQLEVVFRALTAGEIKLDAFASSTQFPVPVSIQTVAAITAQDEDCVSGDCVNNCGQCGAMGITPLLLTLNLAGIKWRMRRTRELRNRMAS